ncbi:MAG TPA: tetratricopeptide repeat protein [Spirochaetota bacterium]|nr:tetratricopeptide repeat protein [Spirochaetota bacterium]HOD16779.1 tetratricopeptide repeat protein [Spirochaetota bacterium]HQL80759.1 tetratricopeptide repeat protein [Spirochaetota bacterium]
MTQDRNSAGPGPEPIPEDALLEKNRISGIEAVTGDTVIASAPSGSFDKKPVIILSIVAAVLIAGILVLTQFVYKKPQPFTRSSANPNAPFEETGRGEGLTSDNQQIIRGAESYSRGYLSDAISEFNGVVESAAPDRDKAIALTYLGIISDEKGEYDKALDYLNRARTYDDKNPEIYKNLAIVYRHRKEFDKALESAQMSTSLSNGASDSSLLTGNIYFESGRYDEAIAAYREVLAKSPDNPRVLYNLGSALMKKGDEFAAIEYFKQAGAADRIGDVAHKAYSRLGVMSIERKSFEDAEKYLKQAVAIRPGDALNHYNLGIAYLRQNKTAEALQELEKAEATGEADAAVLEGIGDAYFSLKSYDKSLDIYNRLSRGNERNVRILSRIGEIYYEKGELDGAYEAYRKITTIEPATENARIAYMNMGNILDDEQRYEDAIEAYQRALAISPKDDAAYYNLGIAYKHAGKPELAITAWKKAAELDPGDAAPSVAIADYYYERGFYDMAESEYRRIVGKWPSIQEPHFKIGTMYFKRGNFDYALNAFDKVIELDPNSDLARKALINKAILVSKTGTDEKTLDKSRNLVQKALLMKPDDTEALFALGIIFMKKEQYDNAMDTFYQVVKGSAEPKQIADAYNNIGKCYYKKRQYKKALQAFTRGIGEDPGSEELRMNRKAASQAYEAELGRD